MSALGIFSYLVVFSIFLLNSFKSIKGILSANILFASLLIYIFVIEYFSNIHTHYLFPVLVSLFYVSYYSVLTYKSKKIESANLFINAGQILLPLFLIRALSIWEQLVVIALLESVRLVSSSGYSTKRTTHSIANLINVNLKLFLLMFSFVLLFIITGENNPSAFGQISSYLILLPTSILFLLTYVFSGGCNSKTIELINTQDYKSKNILAYTFIYQFLVPFILLFHIKKLLLIMSFDVYQDALHVIYLTCFFTTLYMTYQLATTKDINYKFLIIKSLSLSVINLGFLFIPEMSAYIYILLGLFITILNAMLIIGNQYKIKYKKPIMFITLLVAFVTPVSPMFYYILTELTKLEVLNADYVNLLVFMIILILNFSFINISKYALSSNMNKNYNKYATQRFIYLIVGAFLTMVTVAYDKI